MIVDYVFWCIEYQKIRIGASENCGVEQLPVSIVIWGPVGPSGVNTFRTTSMEQMNDAAFGTILSLEITLSNDPSKGPKLCGEGLEANAKLGSTSWDFVG